jgi:hypothetical protein
VQCVDRSLGNWAVASARLCVDRGEIAVSLKNKPGFCVQKPSLFGSFLTHFDRFLRRFGGKIAVTFGKSRHIVQILQNSDFFGSGSV